MVRYIWGVDSAQKVTEKLYQCVFTEFSFPNFWGRYLTTIPKVSDGLVAEEVNLLKRKGVRILPIYNNFKRATGYHEGKIVARNAIFHARRLGIPTGTILFAHIGRLFAVDEAWIRGWVDTLMPSGYMSGMYHAPTEGDFATAYCEAIKNDKQVKAQLVLWSAEPELKPTSLKKAPAFNPVKPECAANVWGWQYGHDAEKCPIDTNLVNKKLFDLLWQ